MNRVLIHGRSRSGTTITRKILSKHSEIQIFEENRIYQKNVNEILNIEKKLYDGKTKFFGDKTGTFKLTHFEFLKSFKINYILIYRDGRDVVSSAFRAFEKNKNLNKKKIWRSLDVYKNSYNWARIVNRGLKAYEKYKPHLKLRFEDYFDYPGKNAKLVADFLNINKEEMIRNEHKMFNISGAHIGEYVKWIPDWATSFHPEALKKLEELNYINKNK